MVKAKRMRLNSRRVGGAVQTDMVDRRQEADANPVSHKAQDKQKKSKMLVTMPVDRMRDNVQMVHNKIHR